jgi:hypothetical protein
MHVLNGPAPSSAGDQGAVVTFTGDQGAVVTFIFGSGKRWRPEQVSPADHGPGGWYRSSSVVR